MSSARAQTRTLAEDPLGGTVRRSVLPNGLRIITEAVPAMHSVSFGVWVGVGSRDESRALSGGSHFLEHLLFKGTQRRTALEISAAIEAVGGETNAYTSKEYTCYYARVLSENASLAIDVMCDLVLDSVLAPADVEVERGVILEEIAMHDDEPGDEVHDLFARALYGEQALGRPISGTSESITAMPRRQIEKFYRTHYVPSTMVVAVAGELDHATVVRQVKQAFARAGWGDETATPQQPRGAAGAGSSAPRLGRGRFQIREKETEQAHLILGGAGLSRMDERRFALGVLNNALGGGMSSRLFQEIRERRGLAYSVYSFTSHFADTGMFGVYAGCAPGKAEEVLELARLEMDQVAAAGLTDEEVRRGKGMYKGAVVLGLEDTGSRMSELGKGELLYGQVLRVEQFLAKIDAVTPDDVRAVAAEVLGGPLSLAVIGPLAGRDLQSFVRR